MTVSMVFFQRIYLMKRFNILFNEISIPIIESQHRPNEIPWSEHDVDLVIEATGKFKLRNTTGITAS